LDLGNFALRQKGGANSNYEIQGAAKGRWFHNSFPGFTGTTAPEQVELAVSDWAVLPSTTKEKIALMKSHLAAEQAPRTAYGPVSVGAKVFIIRQPTAWRKKVAEFLESEEGKSAITNLTGRLSGAILPATQEEATAQAVAQKTAEAGILKIQWDLDVATLELAGLSGTAKMAQETKISYLKSLKCSAQIAAGIVCS